MLSVITRCISELPICKKIRAQHRLGEIVCTKKANLIDTYRGHMVHFQALTVKGFLKLTKEKIDPSF